MILRSYFLSATLLSLGLLTAQSDAELAEQVSLETAFRDKMSGCRMSGHFTEKGSDKAPQEDSYTIASIKKLRDEKWQFNATIEYGSKHVTLPLAVDVYWAGDTPTIQVTDLSIPLLGTFNARVVIHGDQYSGMWSGKDHGGFMYGTIERTPETPQKAASTQGTANWASWRGPNGSGEASKGNPPTKWSEDENIVWKTQLKGLGNSTPIVWGNRIYVTTAIEQEEAGKQPEQSKDTKKEREQESRRGRRRRFGRGQRAPTKQYDFRVMAIDKADGSIVWNTSVAKEVPHESGHNTGSQASSSPITDGENIYAHFGSRGIHCLSMDGEVQWSRNFGKMRTRNQFGEGSSPALSGNTLIINWDHEDDSFIYALDKRTGKEIWSRPRDEVTSWSTPVIAKVEGREQVIVSATRATRAYDLESGEVIWSCKGMTTNAIPTPIVQDGVAYIMSGFRGAALQAIKLKGAKGDVSDSENFLWSHNRQTSYVPSALLYDNLIYFMRSNNAVMSCIDAATGEVAYEGQRLPGIRTVYSSPVGVDGRIYIPSRGGATKVIKAGATFEEIATNQLNDVFDASPVVIGDDLLLRGRESLYCIREVSK
jgi:outer membrane protein assembly factor BamB